MYKITVDTPAPEMPLLAEIALRILAIRVKTLPISDRPNWRTLFPMDQDIRKAADQAALLLNELDRATSDDDEDESDELSANDPHNSQFNPPIEDNGKVQ